MFYYYYWIVYNTARLLYVEFILFNIANLIAASKQAEAQVADTAKLEEASSFQESRYVNELYIDSEE